MRNNATPKLAVPLIVTVVLVCILALMFQILRRQPPEKTGRSESASHIADLTSNRQAGQDDAAAVPAQQANPNEMPLDAEPQLAFLPTLENRRYDSAIREVVVREDPLVDGWESEQFSLAAENQLKKLGQLLSRPETIDQLAAASLCSAKYEGQSLRPNNPEVVFDGPRFQVRRSAAPASDLPHEGPTGFLNALRGQAELFAIAKDVYFKFKIFRVTLDSADAVTTAYFQMSGLVGPHQVQVNATWECTWELAGASTPPVLLSIRVSDYEEISSPRNPGPMFVDCTQSAFSNSAVLRDQLVHGRDHWYGNLEASMGVEGRGNGIAIGDVNGDGLDDIYLCQPAALPNRLLLRRRDGSLTDVSAAAGVDWLDSSRGALLVDVDNDGDQDLLLAQSTQLLLHENDGTGSFQVRLTLETPSRLFSMSAADYDQDGDLDLFVCGYSSASQARPEDIFASPMPYHDANNGGPNLLLRNEGNWGFQDVTDEVGLDANNLRFSLASAWEDYDNDGDEDLYVANDFGRNNLYRNDNGRFTDVAAQSGVEDIGPGMSASWGDYNNDGWVDLYVSNMFSSAGSRITQDPKFKSDANEEDIAGFRRHARGNSLFENRGGMFTDRGIESGTTMGRWAWGSLFVDINNDGWQDVYVTNGFVTADENQDL